MTSSTTLVARVATMLGHSAQEQLRAGVLTLTEDGLEDPRHEPVLLETTGPPEMTFADPWTMSQPVRLLIGDAEYAGHIEPCLNRPRPLPGARSGTYTIHGIRPIR